MSALEFLVRGRREITVAYFNHATPHSDDAEGFLESFCSTQSLPLVVGKYKHKNSLKEPTEASWRIQRYEFFKTFDTPVVTGHHLKDAVEWWIFSSLRGNPTLISPVREDIPALRPFIMSHPDDLHTRFREYPHIEDPSNASLKFTRNFIRHEILHRAQRVNPGLYTTIKNMYEKEITLKND